MGMTASLAEIGDADLPRLHDVARVAALFDRTGPSALSLEKAWHGLDYLLNDSAERGEPLGFLLAGGVEVGASLGYGRPRLLDPDFVRRLDAALRDITDDQFWGRFNARRFEEEIVSPNIWDEPPDELRKEYVGYFHQIREFTAEHQAADALHSPNAQVRQTVRNRATNSPA